MIECRERRELLRVQDGTPVYGCRVHVECANGSLQPAGESAIKNCDECRDLIRIRVPRAASRKVGGRLTTIRSSCIHRGREIRTQYCRPCKSRTGRAENVPVFACGIHTECVLESTGLHIKPCNVCRDRVPYRELRMTPETCPNRAPCGLHRVTCRLVARHAGVPVEKAVIPASACEDCCLQPAPSATEPNSVVAHFARRTARKFNPDGASAVEAEMIARDMAPEERPATRTVVLNADAHGFGDAMVTAWIAEGSKAGPVKLIHHATGAKRDFLELFGQEVTPSQDGAVTTFRAYEIETRRERGKIPRVISRAKQLGILTPPKRPTLLPLPKDAIDLAAEIRYARTNGGKRPFVLLCPQTVWRSREWPAAYWVDLGWQLHKAGYGVGFNLEKREDRFENVPQFYFAYPWPHVCALMMAADLVIGIDSAPIHVAGTLARPTLCLLGPTTASVISHCPSVTCLAPTRERMECVGCWFNAPYRAACDQGCMALARLYVEDVVEKVKELVPCGS